MGRRISTKTLEKARSLKAVKERHLRIALISLCVAVTILIGYSFIANSGALDSAGTFGGMLINALFMVLAGVVGVNTYKWSGASRTLKELMTQNGITEEDL